MLSTRHDSIRNVAANPGGCCPANSAHIGQSRLDPGLVFQVQVHSTRIPCKLFPVRSEAAGAIFTSAGHRNKYINAEKTTRYQNITRKNIIAVPGVPKSSNFGGVDQKSAEEQTESKWAAEGISNRNSVERSIDQKTSCTSNPIIGNTKLDGLFCEASFMECVPGRLFPGGQLIRGGRARS